METIKISVLSMADYHDKVEDYLEYLGYHELVEEFEPVCVASTLVKAVYTFWHHGESFRMCAITIWSLTMSMKVMPAAKLATKH